MIYYSNKDINSTDILLKFTVSQSLESQRWIYHSHCLLEDFSQSYENDWGTTPLPRRGACAGAGGTREATPHSRSGGGAVRRYPSSKVRSSGCAFLEPREEIPHVKHKRNPSKTVGVARGHQRADTVKPYSQKTSQSNHTRTTALSNSM